MLFRFHRGSLADSMQTVVEVADRAALLTLLQETDPSITDDDLTSQPYGFDPRIDWDTHLVLVRGIPQGMTNSAVLPE